MNSAVAEMLIHGSLQKVFDAFVNPATIVQFWLAKTSGPLVLGTTVDWEFMVPGAREKVKVTALSAPVHLAFAWSDDVHIDMHFTAQGPNAAIVRVTAEGFSTPADAVGATEGFSIVLCDLKTLIETGNSANLVRDKATLIAQAK